MNSPPGFIDLDRRFRVLACSALNEEYAAKSYLFDATQDVENLHWSDVLAKPLVVILGEPGSGKSREFRNIANKLKGQREEAFYFELERLVSRSLTELLGRDEQNRFRKWLRSNRTAHFFLDSVDEAKLRCVADFYKALDTVRNAIGTLALDRASFVVSSRISEWQPATDQSEVLARLARTPTIPRVDKTHQGSEKADESIVIVQIQPLTREQVRTYISGKGIDDADQFIEAIDGQHAWEFARRPLDVNNLAEFWQNHHRLGTLTEIIEDGITHNLRETTKREKSFQLSEADARLGAEVLAAATIFCKQIQFKVPDNSMVGPNALDAVSCLPPTWKPDQCAALLSRPLFDCATYGTIRFHHRRVSEYLAAAFLRRHMAEGCPTSQLLHLLFDEIEGEKVARQSLLPVIAWLCAGDAPWNFEVRSWVLATAPELHLGYGDAAALPIDYRRSVLKEFITRNEGRSRVWLNSTPDALSRLASPDLANDISELLRNPATSKDVREELIMLVRFGRLEACLPTLLDILSDAEADDGLLQTVLAAIRDMGTLESLQQAWDIIQMLGTMSDRIGM